MMIVDGWTGVTFFRGICFFDFLAGPCWPGWPIGGGINPGSILYRFKIIYSTILTLHHTTSKVQHLKIGFGMLHLRIVLITLLNASWSVLVCMSVSESGRLPLIAMIMAWADGILQGGNRPENPCKFSCPAPLKNLLAKARPCTLMEHLLLTKRLYGPCRSTQNLVKNHFAAKSHALEPAQC